MAKVIVGMTMSLDGFVSDRNGDISRLYPDLDQLRKAEFLQEEIRATGADVMGRRAYDMGQGDFTDYEFQVPIFVLTHAAPTEVTKGQNDRLTLTFVTDGIESAINKAKAAAGDRDVMVIGSASTSQQCLKAGLADELSFGIVPILLGGGLRWFEDLGGMQIELEKIKVYESPGRIDIRYRVLK